MEGFRQVLYPPNAAQPTSKAPVGAHHEQVYHRLAVILPDPEVHETIERAFKLFSRKKRQAKNYRLYNQWRAMEAACDELRSITQVPEVPETLEGTEGIEGSQGVTGGQTASTDAIVTNAAAPLYNPRLYDEATKRPNPYSTPKPQGRRISPAAKWRDARIEGLVPREAWVPVETRGKGWNYDWVRPSEA